MNKFVQICAGLCLFGMVIILLTMAILTVLAVASHGDKKSNENCAVLAPLQGYISVHNERSGELV